MINPVGMTLKAWADAVVLTCSNTWSTGKLDDETRWREWATAFLRSNPTAQQIPPDPYQFDDWRAWAERAFTMLEAT